LEKYWKITVSDAAVSGRATAKLMINTMRLLNKLYANLFGYFWIPCPLCGNMFGGHEVNERTKSIIKKNGHGGIVICQKCSAKWTEVSVVCESEFCVPYSMVDEKMLLSKCVNAMRQFDVLLDHYRGQNRHVDYFSALAAAEKYLADTQTEPRASLNPQDGPDL
jgi:hypothetical protein